MEAYGYIYLTFNKTNNKIYIGQHKGHWDSKYFGSGKILKQAIKKYGIENFDCYPLCLAFSKEELNQLEIDFISYYRPEYNITKGGEGCSCSLPKTEEHKRKIGEGNKGKVRSEEARKKNSEAHKNQIPWNKGKTNIYSEETKRKISDTLKKNKIKRVA
jgi:group I intron endonuclease